MRNKELLRCLYCGKLATTKDHVPSKCLLEKPYPNNLLTVPACEKCNNDFSPDEEYFLNLLVEISLNPTLLAKKEIGGSVYRARQKSIKLSKRILEAKVLGEDGREYIKPEYEKVKKVIEKNALGLYYKKYNLHARLEQFQCLGIYPYEILETRPSDIFMLTHKQNFTPKKWTCIQANVFYYIIVRDWKRDNKLSMIFQIHNAVWAVIAIPFPNYLKKFKRRLQGQLELFNVL